MRKDGQTKRRYDMRSKEIKGKGKKEGHKERQKGKHKREKKVKKKERG